jgi:dihydrodipicolinate synthase/N-acetylneuraminate lyase
MAWEIEDVKKELRGPVALIMAPFHEDLSLNVAALRSNLRFLVDAGVRMGEGFAICPCGTGEYLSLTDDEHQQMLEVALETVDGAFPVVAGVAGLNIDRVIDLGQRSSETGARYVMIPPPCYYQIDEQGMYGWYRSISESLDAGVMIYDQSWRASLGTKLTIPLIERLAGLPGIVSLKYGSAGIFDEMIAALDRYAGRFVFIDTSLGFTSTVAHMHGSTGSSQRRSLGGPSSNSITSGCWRRATTPPPTGSTRAWRSTWIGSAARMVTSTMQPS